MDLTSTKNVRKIVGFIVLIIILLRGPWIADTVEKHVWVGVVLLVCAIAYVLWGMFWD